MIRDDTGRRKADAASIGQQRESKRINGDMAMADLQDIDREKQAKLSRLRAERQAREAGAGEPNGPSAKT